MKGLFPQYDTSSKKDYEKIWSEALFVFDTNVLLNLYRYQSSTSKQLLQVFENLSPRIWIPHHVALEFQRNRVKVIADQSTRFAEVRTKVRDSQKNLKTEIDKLQLEKRHSLIDPKPLIDGFGKLAEEFLDTLGELEKKQQSLNEEDPLKEKLEELFSGKVGAAPSDQKEVDKLDALAKERFALEMPPGFKDQGKDDNGQGSFSYGGILFEAKYGDYYVWNQILEYTKPNEVKAVIFVTDDGKEDWWWKIKSGGAPETLGPRPELVEEARRVGGVSDFLMYKPDGFLKRANTYLSTSVSEDVLDEVRDVSAVRKRKRPSRRVRRALLESELTDLKPLVSEWLDDHVSKLFDYDEGPFDFVAQNDDQKIGIVIKGKVDQKASLSWLRYMKEVVSGHEKIANADVVWLVFVAPSLYDATQILEAMKISDLELGSSGILRATLGYVANLDGKNYFREYHRFHEENAEASFRALLSGAED